MCLICLATEEIWRFAVQVWCWFTRRRAKCALALGRVRGTQSVKSGISILIAFPGERLDYCSCESLEEILKSVQFDFISLRGAELEENVSVRVLWTFECKNDQKEVNCTVIVCNES